MQIVIQMCWIQGANRTELRAISKICNAGTGRFEHNTRVHELIRDSLAC